MLYKKIISLRLILVGALTNKAYAFKNRPWELIEKTTVDILDALSSNVKIFLNGSEIKRILPSKNDIVNENWISNNTRFFFEGLKKWRINVPLIKNKNNLIYVSWLKSFYFLILKIWFYSIFFKSKNLVILSSDITDHELLITSKI